MREVLLKLIDLQKIDSQLMDIEELKGDLPAEVARLDKQLESLSAGIADSKVEIEELSSKRRRLEAEVSDTEATVKKYQDQLILVSTNRAYDALMAEIDTAKQSAESDGMQALEIEEKIQQLTEQVKADEIALEEKTGLFAKHQKSLQQTIEETEVEATRLAGERKRVESKIDSSIYQNYERMRGAHNGEAVVEMSRGSCGSCFSELPAQLSADIRAMNSIITCPTCGVILYHSAE